MHNNTWASNTMLSFRKKLMSQSRENFKMEGWKDRQTLIHRTLLAMAGGPKTIPKMMMTNVLKKFQGTGLPNDEQLYKEVKTNVKKTY